MKAVRIHEYGDVDRLVYEDVPDPQPGPGEVLVQQVATSVNPIDWKVLSGAMRQFMPLKFPAILGRDAAGTVKQVGNGVTQFKAGDPVIALANNTYAELVVAKTEAVAAIPKGLDLAVAAALPLVTLTGTQLIEDQIVLQRGQTVLVTGALGGVGRSAVRAAKLAGATVVAGIRASQREEAEELKADSIFVLDDESQYTKRAAFDAVADTVGPEVTAKLLSLVKPGGKVVTVTRPPPNAAQFPQVSVGAFQVHPDGKRLAEIALDVHRGTFRIPIDRRLPLAQARQGVAAARQGGIGKVLLLP